MSMNPTHRRLLPSSVWCLLLGMGPAFSSDCIADGPIKIMSANVTSLRKNWP